MARIAGMALIALGIACWPGASVAVRGDRRRTAMLVYGALAAIYLSGLGVEGTLRGPLLWPAVAAHVWRERVVVPLDSIRTIRMRRSCVIQ